MNHRFHLVFLAFSASGLMATAGAGAAFATDLPDAGIDDNPNIVVIAPNGGLQIGAINLKLGGFSELATFWRSRNEVADVGSTFGGIPYGNDPRYYENELRFSARQSRIAALASGDMDEYTHLAAYIESDFLGVGTSSNSVESNSYVPRIRHFYGTLDYDPWGIQVLAGQTWSLLTTNTEGIKARSELIPLTIDAQYVVGFNWTRNPQIRIVKSFSPMISAGLSIESPQAANVAGTTPGGVVINASNSGGPLLNSGAQYSNDIMPDIVGKIAFDPGFGHYELKGILRGFTDRASHDNQTTVGGGGGISATVPIIPKTLEVQGSVLAGTGIGRYGAGQLAEATFDQDGSLTPIPEVEVLAGLVAHPRKGTDIYAYGGLEQVSRTVSGAAGYGLNVNNSGCAIESTSSICQAQTKRLWEVTGGFWHDIYNGEAGRAMIGAEGEYVKKEAFESTNGGAATTDETIVMASFRYYPFK